MFLPCIVILILNYSRFLKFYVLSGMYLYVVYLYVVQPGMQLVRFSHLNVPSVKILNLFGMLSPWEALITGHLHLSSMRWPATLNTAIIIKL